MDFRISQIFGREGNFRSGALESERLVWHFEEEILLNEILGCDKKLNEALERDYRRFVF